MSNEIEVMDRYVAEIENTKKICQALIKTPHYTRLGAEGVFAIIEKAKSIGMSPIDALNGAMFYVQGKVELSAGAMNQLIRSEKHSITKDKRSDNTVCILHGKRADNGDTWVASFSIEEAKLAGIWRGQWLKYPQDMLFARALSRLARQLFPDVIKGMYVQGEIEVSPPTNAKPLEIPKQELESISEEQYQELIELLQDNEVLTKNIVAHMQKKWDISNLKDMPLELYDIALSRAKAAKEQENG